MIPVMKNLAPFLAAACLTILIVGAAIVLTASYGAWGFAAVAAAVIVGGLVSTWWFADDQPALAGPNPQRVTFLMVVQNTVRDLGAPKLAGWARRVWSFWGPRVTNTVLVALIAFDAYVFQEPTLKAAIEATQFGWAFLLALHLFATVAPRGAPDRIPAPGAA